MAPESVGTQAEALVPLLKPLGIGCIYSSPYLRCRKTVEPLSRGLNIEAIIDPELRERTVMPRIRKDFKEIWHRSWQDFSFALSGCESSSEAQRRFVEAVLRIMRKTNGVTGICSHGNVIALLLNHLEPRYGPEDADQMTTPDVLKLGLADEKLTWDRKFRLRGIEDVATPVDQTPVDW